MEDRGTVDGTVDQPRSRMLVRSSFALGIKKQTETSCWKMVEYKERNNETFIVANTLQMRNIYRNILAIFT